MGKSNSTWGPLAREVPGFDTDRYDSVRLEPDSRELQMLERLYAPLKFNWLIVELRPPFRLLQAECQDVDIVHLLISVRGAFADLVRHRFAHPSWDRTPPCGTTRHRTAGFGGCRVRRTQAGEHTVSYLKLDHALDLLAPLSAMWFRPPSRGVTHA